MKRAWANVGKHVLISKLVAQAHEDPLNNDEMMHIGCFLRTWMLLTLAGSDDDEIKLQGLTIPFIT